MNRVEIILISPQQGKLDIDKNTEVPFTFSVGDIRDITQKKGTFSKTIKLAGTKNNNILLNNYFDVNIQAGTFDVNRLQKCQVLQNGVPILTDGYMQLLSINKVQNIINTEAYVEYDVVIKDNVSDLFTKINGLELTDIEFGNYDHIFTGEHVLSTLNNTWEDGYKYFYQYNNGSTQYNLSQMKPAIFAKVYFDKIFENAGFTYEWDTFSADTVQFDKLIIPYNGDQLKVDQRYIDEIKVIAVNTNDVNYSAYTQLSGFTEIQDINDYFNPSTGEYTNEFYISNGPNITFTYKIDYEVVIKNYESSTSYLNGINTNGGLRYLPKIKLYLDEFATGNILPVDAMGIGENADTFVIENGLSLAAGAEYSFGDMTRIVTVGTAGSLPNDIWFSEIGFDGALANQFSSQIDNNLVEWQTTNIWGSPAAPVYPIVKVKNIELTISPNLQIISYNSTMRMNQVIPTKIKQSDFIKSILTMYNLYVLVDPIQPNNIIFKHRDEFYDEGIEVDWTEKLAKDYEQTLTLLPNVISKKLIMTYKQDENDIMLKGYLNSTKEIYGQVEYTFDSDYVRNIETKELIFSPMVVGKDGNTNVLPYIDNTQPKTNIKIALNAYQYESVNPLTLYNFESGTLTGTSVTGTTVPLISHFDDVANPSFDINFSTNDFYFYILDGLTNNNLYNLHWRRTINQINNGKMLTAYFKLNENDINQLKLNQKVFINNAWWNINQIIDYKAGKNELTKVELLSIDDELVFAPFISKDSGLATQGDTTLQIVRDFVTKSNQSTNIIIGTNPVTINGTGNFISAGAVNSTVNGNNNSIVAGDSFVNGNNNTILNPSFIYGSNNVVDENVTNAVIFGSGISATTGNTLYTNNIVIPSGGTLNGVSVSAITANATVWEAGSGTDSAQLVGSGSLAQGSNSVAEGISTLASAQASHAEGYLSTASGTQSHAEGYQTTAIGVASHAEGRETTASGDYNHAEGYLTTALGGILGSAHAEGRQTSALGFASHAEGYLTRASGDVAHAEGESTTANGATAHAEGTSTTAGGSYTHAEGWFTTASGNASHAEGAFTIAIGDASHAEGNATISQGSFSHAEGSGTTASGNYSYAGGRNSIANNFAEFARATPIIGTTIAQTGLATFGIRSTNATPISLSLNGTLSTERFVLVSSSVYLFKLLVVGKASTSGDITSFEVVGAIKNIGGTTSIVGTPTITTIAQDAALTTTNVAVSADNTNDALQIDVTGVAATNIDWNASIWYSAVRV